MRLGWWSRLKFEPRRHRMAINHRPLSGQLLPLAHPTKPSFERLVYSETCRMPYGSISAFADIKVQARVRQLLVAFLTFVPWQPACQVPPYAYAYFRPWAAFRLAVRQRLLPKHTGRANGQSASVARVESERAWPAQSKERRYT
jgi:hypothetical protein